jgi:DNA-binding transcriptional MerR regulator
MTDPPASEGREPSNPGDSPGWTTVGIGEAARILDVEFGDVTVSKIRYLQMRGLISPTRTRGGSRRFGQADLHRLRYIIRCQRELFLPLDEIARRLDQGLADDASQRTRPLGADDPEDPAAVASQPPAPTGALLHILRPDTDPGDSLDLAPEDLIRLCGCSVELLQQMRQHGLIGHDTTADVPVCQSLDRLNRFGIEPRHVRWLTQSAERAVTLVDASLPRRKRATARTEAENEEARRVLAAELITVYALLIRKAMIAPESPS